MHYPPFVALINALIERNALGEKTGKGFYDWSTNPPS